MVLIPESGRRGAFASDGIVAAPAAITNFLVDAVSQPRALTAADLQSGARRSEPLGGRAKRLFDVAVSAALLIVLAPLMLLVAAVVKLNIGTVISRQQRVGFGGRSFTRFTFNTMPANADDLLRQHFVVNPAAAREWMATGKLREDPRVGCLGNVLGRTGLDVLPLLINVLKGDMSLVGPQPATLDDVASYGRRAVAYRAARPGMISLWQVAGRPGAADQAHAASDYLYARKWSLGLDLAVLLRAVTSLQSSKRAA